MRSLIKNGVPVPVFLFFMALIGLSVSGLGMWQLSQLVSMYHEFGTYPDGEHLFGGSLFALGAAIALGAIFVDKFYKNKKKQ